MSIDLDPRGIAAVVVSNTSQNPCPHEVDIPVRRDNEQIRKIYRMAVADKSCGEK